MKARWGYVIRALKSVCRHPAPERDERDTVPYPDVFILDQRRTSTRRPSGPSYYRDRAVQDGEQAGKHLRERLDDLVFAALTREEKGSRDE